MNQPKIRAILFALLAAVFYAVNVPVSKLLLERIGPTMLAALLYLGAGLGIGLLWLCNPKDRAKAEKLNKKDLPFVIGMIVLDIAAPIFLMLGIRYGNASSASLLGNFEIVATTVIALLVFREAVSGRLWLAVGLITLAAPCSPSRERRASGSPRARCWCCWRPPAGAWKTTAPGRSRRKAPMRSSF